MIKKYKVIFISVLMLSFFSCKNENDTLIKTYGWDYIGDSLYIKQIKDSSYYFRKTLKLFLKHEKNINLDQYDIVVDIDHYTSYFGKFKHEIDLQKVYLKKHTDIHDLSISLINRKHNKIYIWSSKNSYTLDKYNCIYLKLLVDNEDDVSYRVKFDNQFFYHK